MTRGWWLAGALLCGAPRLLAAQTGLLVVAHGADSAWNARVEATVRDVRWLHGPVRSAYLMGSGAQAQSWDAGVRALVAAGAKSIVVVPLMVSTYGEHVTQIRYYAGEIAALPASLAAMGHDHHASHATVPMRVTPAIDGAAELGQILASRWKELPATSRGKSLVFVAHGPSADTLAGRWLQGIGAAAAPLATSLGRDNVRIGLLRDDAAPAVRAAAIAAMRDTITALAKRTGDSVTVMTVLISSGGIDRVKVPNDLAGMPMRYVGASLAPHPALARWIERVGEESGEERNEKRQQRAANR